MRPVAPDVGDRVPEAEQVVTEAFKAFEAQDWQGLVELTDSDGVVALRKSYVEFKIGRFKDFEASLESLTLQSDGDEQFAEYLATRRQFGELAGITTIEQVHALTNDEFLIRWAQARDSRYLVNGVEPWHNHQSAMRRAVVGSVAVTPDVVAVVVRVLDSIGLNALANYSMIAVIGDGVGTWRLDAATGWLGLADAYF